MNEANDRPGVLSTPGHLKSGGDSATFRVNHTTSPAAGQSPGDVYIFPVDTNKRPLTEHGLLDASNDSAVFAPWWKRWPGGNMAIALGKSGLVAVDAEGLIKHGVDGCAGWDRLKRELGFSDAGAWLQDTPSGGCHYVFSDPDGQIRPANDDKLGGHGYEVRAGGQYIVGPGGFANSQGDNGRYSGMYRPLNQWVGCPAAVPAALREYLLRVAGYDAKSQPAPPVGDTIPAGSRNQTLASLAGTMRRRGMAQEAIEAALLAENATRCKPPLLDDEVRAIAASIGRYAATPEPALPEMPPWMAQDGVEAMTPGDTNTGYTPAMGAHPKAQVSTWLDTGKIIGPIVWAWPQWLPCGFLTLLAGSAGKGKSTLALRIAACFLRGDPWPDGSAFTGEQGSVLWCETEGAQALNLERAGKWGLPVDRILNPLSDPLAEVSLDNPQHQQAIEAAARLPEVRLIIVDSLSGALGPGRDEKDSKMLTVMKWLGRLARDTGKPPLVTHHLRKRSQFETTDEVSLERVRGSTAIVQVSRLVWGMDCPDPAQKETLRMIVLKSNLGRFPPPIGLTIDDFGMNFIGAPERPQKLKAGEIAERFLLTILAQGPVRATEVDKQAMREGISEATLNRVRKVLGVDSRKDGKNHYWLSLPSGKAEDEMLL